MTHQIGDRATCECGRTLIWTSTGWKHSGLGETKCTPNPIATPLTEAQAKKLLPAIYDDDLDGDPGVVLEYHEAPEDEPEVPPSVADLYRVLSDQLTPVQQTMLKAFWLLMAEDSRMLDWLEAETRSYHGFGAVDELITAVAHGKPLREAIKERMTNDA